MAAGAAPQSLPIGSLTLQDDALTSLYWNSPDSVSNTNRNSNQRSANLDGRKKP